MVAGTWRESRILGRRDACVSSSSKAVTTATSPCCLTLASRDKAATLSATVGYRFARRDIAGRHDRIRDIG